MVSASGIWLIVGVVILLLFGGNRFSDMMGDVAKGLKSFKKGMSRGRQAGRAATADRRRSSQQQPIDITPEPRRSRPAPPPPRDDQSRQLSSC